jgi:hypothetical protein
MVPLWCAYRNVGFWLDLQLFCSKLHAVLAPFSTLLCNLISAVLRGGQGKGEIYYRHRRNSNKERGKSTEAEICLWDSTCGKGFFEKANFDQ